MNYSIQNSEDFSAGAVLTVFIPEEDLDEKALYTIQADHPPFLVPFSFFRVDGQVKINYKLGNLTKLMYRLGTRSREECIEFWESVLQPLLDCNDWFLNPDCFALETQYMYVDKDEKTICYLYIPSQKNCVEFGALKSLVIELAEKNSVNDVDLENKILRAIMQDFQPSEFLKMLREARPAASVKIEKIQHEEPKAIEHRESINNNDPIEPAAVAAPVMTPVATKSDGDIVIDIHGGGKKKKNHKENKDSKKETKKDSKGLFGKRKEEKQKETKQKDSVKFKAKENKPKEIMIGAVAEPIYNVQPAPVMVSPEIESEVTMLDDMSYGPHLRFVGEGPLPQRIPVNAEVGKPFTIGRFDISVGHRQSSFEFEKDTSAVSRHHAAIELLPSGQYVIIDQSSKAGTYVNGEKLVPNITRAVKMGDRVSFGTGGADYIWED